MVHSGMVAKWYCTKWYTLVWWLNGTVLNGTVLNVLNAALRGIGPTLGGILLLRYLKQNPTVN